MIYVNPVGTTRCFFPMGLAGHWNIGLDQVRCAFAIIALAEPQKPRQYELNCLRRKCDLTQKKMFSQSICGTRKFLKIFTKSMVLQLMWSSNHPWLNLFYKAVFFFQDIQSSHHPRSQLPQASPAPGPRGGSSSAAADGVSATAGALQNKITSHGKI